jgi:hypothetical protein
MPKHAAPVAEGTLALLNGAPPALSYSPAVQALILPPGQQFTIPTTARIYLQFGVSNDTCCAHAVGSAMETRMVGANGLDRLATPIDPIAIFKDGKEQRSLNVSRKVAEKGVATADGIKKASTKLLGAQSIESMVRLLHDEVPLMVDVQVGSDFGTHDGADIYRAKGALTPHAMCIHGYGTHKETGEPFWIAKNSYGPDWGRAGSALLLWGDPTVAPERIVIAMQSVTP